MAQLLSIFVLVSLGLLARAQTEAPTWFQNRKKTANLSIECTGRLSSTGQGDLILPNDQAILSVTIKTEGPNATYAQSEAARLSNLVLEAALRTNAVDQQDVATTSFSLSPYSERQCFFPNGTRTPNNSRDLGVGGGSNSEGIYCDFVEIGSRVENSLSITIHDVNTTHVNATGAVLDSVIYAAQRNVTIDGLSFSASQKAQEAAIVTARELAIRNAFAKMDPSVRYTGVDVGPVVDLSPSDGVSTSQESAPAPAPSAGATAFARSEALSTQSVTAAPIAISGGKTTVSASVSITISLCS